MKLSYWIKGDMVWGNCHSCGTPTKFADITRMSAEDAQAYKATYDEKEVWPTYKILLPYFLVYAAAWLVLSWLGYSPDQIAKMFVVILVIIAPLSLVVTVIYLYREEKKSDEVRRALLRKYGRDVRNPGNWTRWYAAYPDKILILPYGVDELPQH